MNDFRFDDLLYDFNDKARKFSCDLIIKNDSMELRIDDVTSIECENGLAVAQNKLASVSFEIPEIVYFSPDLDNHYVYSFDLDDLTFSFVLQECTL